MESMKSGIRGFSRLSARKKAIVIAALALIAVLFVALCISIGMRANIHKKYSHTIQQLEVHAYENMTVMAELFARIDDPNVDVKGKLLPQLYSRYTTVNAINAALTACDADRALLSAEQLTAFDAAFAQYAEAYRQGSATGLAKADMAVCMEDVQAMVTLYNTPPESEEDKVLIIDASSGKAIEE